MSLLYNIHYKHEIILKTEVKNCILLVKYKSIKLLPSSNLLTNFDRLS